MGTSCLALALPQSTFSPTECGSPPGGRANAGCGEGLGRPTPPPQAAGACEEPDGWRPGVLGAGAVGYRVGPDAWLHREQGGPARGELVPPNTAPAGASAEPRASQEGVLQPGL